MHAELSGKTVLVTGAAGFIPSYVAEGLLKAGANVIGLDNLSTGSRDNMATFADNPNFEFVEGDVTDEMLITKQVGRAAYVYHGAISGIGVSTDTAVRELEVNTKSTLLILEAIRNHPVTRFVYPSSASVYGNATHFPESEDDVTFPTSPYGVSKLAAERYCVVYHQMFGIPLVCLRYFNTYGPRQRRDSIYGGVVSIFISNILTGKPLNVYGDGTQTRDFTYIEDTLAATMAAFTAPHVEGEVINISRGDETTINDLAKTIAEISGKTVTTNHIEKRLVDNISRRYGDISKAKRLLGYNPKTPLAEGLKATFDWNLKTYGKIQ